MDPPTVNYMIGDVRASLRKIPEGSIHMIATSPPFYNLRDYKNPPSVWDETTSCEHEWGEEIHVKRKASDNTGLDGHDSTHNSCAYLYKDTDRRGTSGGRFCRKCNAWLGCLGGEPTFYMYVEHIRDVCREIKRVLRKDGMFYLNLGDSYAGSGKGFGAEDHGKLGSNAGEFLPRPIRSKELADKNIIGIPFRVAFALQDDGWILRSYPPWIKGSAMPDSTPDRPGSAIEFIFQFAKTNDAQYWTHREKNGVREQPEPDYRYIDLKTKIEYTSPPPGFDIKDKEHWKRINLWDGHDYYYDMEAVLLKGKIPAGTLAAKGSEERRGEYGVNARPPEYKEYTGMRNRRNSDWFLDSLRSILKGEQMMLVNEDGDPLAMKVNPKSFPDAHFAVWPESLVRPLILSSTSEAGCCPTCGAPWSRIVEKEAFHISEEYSGKMKDTDPQFSNRRLLANMKARRDAGLPHDNPFPNSRTVGWRPTCSCPEHQPIPATVLDPFCGSGTTLFVAYHLNRNSIGIDINKEYADITMRRFKKKGGYEHKLGEFA